MAQTLVSFSLGPVQDFIAAARTTRDLWTGSYLLSWLTAHAMKVIRTEFRGEVIVPDVTGNPLLQAVARDGSRRDDVRSPCVPQTFLARVTDDWRNVPERCEQAVRGEWRKISDAVHRELDREWGSQWPGWDERWEQQVGNFWDIRVLALRPDQPSVGELQRLLGSDETDEFQLRREYLGRLAAADKNIRHYPPQEYDAQGIADTRPKCSLLGSLGQMGPLSNSREFWRSVVEQQDTRLIAGTRLGRRDRFCAISLVKRFAWGAYFKPEFKKWGVRVDDLSFPDVDTICAGKWLSDATKFGLRYKDLQLWSGHWLRWKDRLDGQRSDAEEREECPDQATWNVLQKAIKELGKPSSYFAVLMLDGDRIGELVRHADESQLTRISRTLADFALKDVQPRVEDKHHGKLVYAGGDDVLALLPTATALACAHQLARQYGDVMETKGIRHDNGDEPTCSAGLVIAHAKANLRDILQAARVAERQAKQDGRNRLTVSVLRRSGEHTSVSGPWGQVSQLAQLASSFASDNGQRGESDRWAYHFRRELDSALPEVPALLDAELRRLLGRAEGVSPEFKRQVQSLWGDFQGHQSVANARRFTQLIQSASFLARGGRE